VPLSRDDAEYIRHAYEAGLNRGRALSAASPFEGAVGYSVAHVDKYSPDQTAWARERFRGEQAWRRGKRVNVTQMIRRLREGPLSLTGADFERYFPGGPEMGEKTGVPGNVFVAAGLTNLISLWMGLTGTAVNVLGTTGHTPVVGMGTGTTAPATSDTTLLSVGGSAWFQSFDASTLGTTSTNGQVVGTVTVGSANANFAWNEWCWATGLGTVTAGSNGGTAVGSPYSTANSWAMVNHKTGVALGSKASGSSWVFSTTFTISLSPV
jgi:hypothetical protein